VGCLDFRSRAVLKEGELNGMPTGFEWTAFLYVRGHRLPFLRAVPPIVIIALGASTVAMPGEVQFTGGRILTVLQQSDKEYLMEFTLSCTVEFPAEPMAGRPKPATYELVLTGRGDVQAARSNYVATSVPLVPFGGLPSDGRNQGLWLETSNLFLLEDSFVGTLHTVVPAAENPDGSLAYDRLAYDEGQTGAHSAQLDLNDRTRPRRTFLDLIALFTAGRGFGEYIHDIVAVSADESGLVECEANGVNYRQEDCQWRLTIDPAAGYMVRRAHAWNPATGFVYVDVTSVGTQWFGDVALPTQGIFRRPHHPEHHTDEYTKHNVGFTSYVPQADVELFALARSRLRENLPLGTRVFDFRETPDKPAVYVIGEDELWLANAARLQLDKVGSEVLPEMIVESSAPEFDRVPAVTAEAHTKENLEKRVAGRGWPLWMIVCLGLIALGGGIILSRVWHRTRSRK
jgi:hypothetical protein